MEVIRLNRFLSCTYCEFNLLALIVISPILFLELIALHDSWSGKFRLNLQSITLCYTLHFTELVYLIFSVKFVLSWHLVAYCRSQELTFCLWLTYGLYSIRFLGCLRISAWPPLVLELFGFMVEPMDQAIP